MNGKYLVSVIIPVYNVAAYLEESMDSVINQSYDNLEIIIVDDGSNDGSEKICDEYAKKDKRIKVIHQENSGVSCSRNFCAGCGNRRLCGFPRFRRRLRSRLCRDDAERDTGQRSRYGDLQIHHSENDGQDDS